MRENDNFFNFRIVTVINCFTDNALGRFRIFKIQYFVVAGKCAQKLFGLRDVI